MERSSRKTGLGNLERSAQDGAHRTGRLAAQGRVRRVVADVAKSFRSMPLTALITSGLPLTLEVSFRFYLVSNS